MTSIKKYYIRTFSVAPMLKRTDRHCRYFFRLIHPEIFLYSEMLTTGAILFGARERYLGFDIKEHPVALQLGGSDPIQLAQCADIAEKFGYDEVNLNVGCPSERVQSGVFGACLMKNPDLVADCVDAMCKKVSIPVTVKTRIGVDEVDSYEHLISFIQKVSKAGCKTFIIHARKAWLKGLSPKENREIPPLNYEWVYQIKRDFPELEIILNGGIKTTEDALSHLSQVDGVMIGRAAYEHPCLLAELYGQPLLRKEIMREYLVYMEKKLLEGEHFVKLIQPIFGLFYNQLNGKRWRRGLSQLPVRTLEAVENLLGYVLN